ncbi:hypothetical protein VNO78_13935 [Psophocarpus tetragonolobus]|uniref:FAS1 domain-containing protein n=1 Tax=Psophocarpus tetragonolobus TaxID=3891 RepID=A0AAN9XPT8_PSOTE
MAYSRWCWFPVYLTASITLGIIAISSAVRSSSKNGGQEAAAIPQELWMKASDALRRAGFIITGDLLDHSPSFFKPPHNSTIFAIKDSAIKNTSHSLWFLKTLLLYHTTTSKAYSFDDLVNIPQGTCLSTLLPHKNVSLTSVSPTLVHINHVPISNPNIFLRDNLAVHGVLAPFSPFLPQDLLLRGFHSVIRSPTCSSNNLLHWKRLLHFLRAKGYASFSVALHSLLNIHSSTLPSATIFAPPHFPYPSSTTLLHILPQRFTYKQLTALPVRTLLKTLMPDHHLEIDGLLHFLTGGLLVNGVQIVVPDMFTSANFVVHGISRALALDLTT